MRARAKINRASQIIGLSVKQSVGNNMVYILKWGHSIMGVFTTRELALTYLKDWDGAKWAECTITGYILDLK